MQVPSVIELGESGAGSVQTSQDGLMSREVELKWLASGLLSYQDAEAKAATLAPLYYSSHRRSRLDVRPIGNTWWELSAGYLNAAIDPLFVDDASLQSAAGGMVEMPSAVLYASTLSFDTTGETEHVTQAWPGDDGAPIETKYPSDAPAMYGAVSVDGNSVNGVDIATRALSFNETWTVAASELLAKPAPLKKKVDVPGGGQVLQDVEQFSLLQWFHKLTGTVNKVKFREFDPGEVLFLGARGEMSRGQTMIPITLVFSARKNREEFMVGDVSVANKKGWDHMWISYEPQAAGAAVTMKAKYVYVDQVYEYADWTPMMIGTTWSKFYLEKSGFRQ